jgi:hypothetical protein
MTPKCECGSDDCGLIKYWTIKGKLPRDKSYSQVTTYLYHCNRCGRNFRRHVTQRQEKLTQ